MNIWDFQKARWKPGDPFVYPASALDPSIKAQEDREEEIERLARLLCSTKESLDPDTLVAIWPLQFAANHEYVVMPTTTLKLWETYIVAATAVYNDRNGETKG